AEVRHRAVAAAGRSGCVLLLKLALERGELGEGRIRIRFLVLAARAAIRLGVILLALGALDLTAALTARPLAARTAVLPLAALRVALLALTALVPVLALLPVAAGRTGRTRRFGAWGLGGGIRRNRRRLATFRRHRGGVRPGLLRLARTTRLVRTPF